MQIQCLNKPQGNYVRHCWGTTPVFQTKEPTDWSAPDGPEGLAAAPTRVNTRQRESPQPNFARNLTRSLFEIAHKRCNSNDANSMFEQATGELRATLLGNHPDQRGGRTHRQAAPVTSRCTRYVALHPLRSATPVTSRCTRYVALHPLRRAAPDQKGCIAYGSGALPTDRVHRITLEHTTEESVAPHVSPAGRNSRSHKSPKPHPQQRNTGSLATPESPRAQPANPTPNTTRPRPVSRPRPRRAQSAPLNEAPPIRRSCPRGPRPRRGQPRGGRRGRGTGSRTRSQRPRCGRSGSTAGRHRARHTRRA